MSSQKKKSRRKSPAKLVAAVKQPEAEVQGTVAPGFEGVREAFAKNFARKTAYRDAGAALSVYHQGRCVADLWGGHADAAGRRPFAPDTLVNLYSATKGVVAIAAAVLAEQGGLRYDARVTDYWPEYGQHGKGRTTVEHLLSHNAGLPGFKGRMHLHDLYDWDKCCAVLARQKPAWRPGRQISYHAVTWGYLVGEVMRRALGRRQTVGQYVRDHLAAPLGADFFIGLPPELDARVAELLPPKKPRFYPVRRAAEKVAAKILPQYSFLTNPVIHATDANRPEWRRAEIPAANGFASARGLARIYGAFAYGSVGEGDDEVTLNLPGAVMKSVTEVYRKSRDKLTGREGTRGMGLSLVGTNAAGEPATLGQVGWGGCMGCANFDANFGIGYVTTRMGTDINRDPRWKSLCAAVCEATGVTFKAG